MEVEGRILTPEGWRTGRLRFGDRIEGVEARPVPSSAPMVFPGFIDLHVPGGGGADVMAGTADAVRTVARMHARHGTTSFLPATVTAPSEDLEAAARAIARVAAAREGQEARVLGAHLEGPCISPEKLGAQPPYARPADRGLLDRLLELVEVRVVTLAPEVDPGHRLIAHLAGRGVRVQLGHTAADYDETLAALAAGAAGFTHLFNAMTPMHHRTPGVVGAALAEARYAAIIPDFVHVHPGAIKTALRAVPKLFCVTDATAAAGMPDGEYPLGRHSVRKRGNTVYLADGTLAGSALTMDQAFRNLIALGLEPDDAVRRLATYPADFLGIADRGRIEPGAWADLVVMESDLTLVAVFVEGQPVRLS